jgi:hypothetical protein
MIMKQLLTICSILLLVACQPGNDNVTTHNIPKYSFTEDSLAILNILNLQQTGWNNGDLEEFMKGYVKSEHLTFTGSRGVTYGWQNTLENYQNGYHDKETMGELKFDIIDLKSLDKEAAQMIGKFTLIRSDDQPTGYFTLIFKKTGDQWKIISDMTVSSPTQ